MRTTKKWGLKHMTEKPASGAIPGLRYCWLLGLVLLYLTACTPPGPRDLLQGKALLDAGKYPEAVTRLETAVSILTTNALAWNYLGLAYHQAQRPVDAEKAYRRALVLNHDLGEARYNLGCLLLEQNKPDLAKSELLAFTLRRGNSVDGFLKLASAQIRLRDLNGAEKSYNDALRINQEIAEAWNGLGLIKLQRGRPVEALQNMNRATKVDAHYPAALLNAGLISQNYMKDPAGAMAKYRAYLALKPLPENAESVRGLLRQLEADAAPQLASPRPALPPTNSTALTSAVNTASTGAAKPPVTNVTAARPNAPTRPNLESSTPAKTSPPLTVVRAPAITSSVPASTSSASAPATSRSAQPFTPANPLDTVRLQEDPSVKEARDVSPARPQPATTRPSTTATDDQEAMALLARQPPPKRSFFEKINPLNLFTSDKKPARKTVTPIPASPSESTSTAAPSNPPVSTPAPVIKRYTYLNPPRPAVGKTSEAQPVFLKALDEYRARRLQEAAALYTAALKLDPSLFEAHYNLAQVWSEIGDSARALSECELALALRPDSSEARYNFALLLKTSGYWLDAAQELEKLLSTRPTDVRAHLLAGNLYAQQLRQPARARVHYQKVLELDPRNSQTGNIAYWLTEHPQ